MATFNLHAGVDGWGRRTRALEHAAALGADVLVCPEMWRGDAGEDHFGALSDALGMAGLFVPLARAERSTQGTGPASWQPRGAHLHGEYGLFFTEHRSLTDAQRARRSSVPAEAGQWGIGLLTRLPIDAVTSEPLERQPRERVRRAIVRADVRLGDGSAFTVFGVHFAHLSHGSFRQFRHVREVAGTLAQDRPVLIAGDFNSWRPPLRLFFPGWRQLVRARTWPARRPHSQIDHVLGSGPWLVRDGGASDGGSDHRALVVDLDLDEEAATAR